MENRILFTGIMPALVSPVNEDGRFASLFCAGFLLTYPVPA